MWKNFWKACRKNSRLDSKRNANTDFWVRKRREKTLRPTKKRRMGWDCYSIAYVQTQGAKVRIISRNKPEFISRPLQKLYPIEMREGINEDKKYEETSGLQERKDRK